MFQYPVQLAGSFSHQYVSSLITPCITVDMVKKRKNLESNVLKQLVLRYASCANSPSIQIFSTLFRNNKLLPVRCEMACKNFKTIEFEIQ